MITQIGIVSGKILDLLDRNNGVLIFGEIHSSLGESRDFVLMGLGALIHSNYICVMEDPLRAVHQNNDNKNARTSEAYMFDLVIRHNADEISSKRIKNLSDHIGAVAAKILILLEGCGGLLALQSLVGNLKENRDIILMGLGWLIRDGYVRGMIGAHEIFILRLSQKTMGVEMESFSQV